MIKVQNLCKSYDSFNILEQVSFEIKKGEVISIIGSSGCGKSTLLRCLGRLDDLTSGKIFFEGEDVDSSGEALIAYRQKVGMVFQNFNLFSHLMVIENIMLGPRVCQNKDKQTCYEEAMALLERVGLAGKAFLYPDEISGGQKQRVAIARTLVMKPEIILFDEPTSALDPTMVTEVLSVIKKLAADGMTMVIVTHEMEFARKVSNRVFFMDEHGIYEDGKPEEIFERPKGEKTREFIYKIQNYHHKIEGDAFDLYAFQAGVERFLRKQLFPERRIQTTQLVVEEVIFHMLFAIFGKKGTTVEFVLRYSVEKDSAELTFLSEQIEENFLEKCDDDLSMMIVQKYSEEISCEKGFLRLMLKSGKFQK